MIPMRTEGPGVAVVGAGAVGCYFGGMLARAGTGVTLIGRGAHMEAIARDGLRLDGLHVRERIPVAASTDLATVRGAGVVLFCVKCVDTETAAREMQPFLSPDAAVLSLQNGVDNADRIFSATGIRAIPVAVYVAAAMTAPGQVTHTGRGDLVAGYRAGWPHEPDLEQVAALFARASVPCRIPPSIETELWTKMVMNCAYNAISAVIRARYGRMIDSQVVPDLMQRAAAETVAVARAEGVPLSLAEVMDGVWKLGRAMTGALSSTAQDLARRKRTEIDFLNGYVSRRGTALGVPTPVNDTLSALVKFLEHEGAPAIPPAFPARNE